MIDCVVIYSSMERVSWHKEEESNEQTQRYKKDLICWLGKCNMIICGTLKKLQLCDMYAWSIKSGKGIEQVNIFQSFLPTALNYIKFLFTLNLSPNPK